MRITPSGNRFEVQPDELFFSTTDPKGVIGLTNDVFNRLARYDRDELRGAPHNIIRHPDMPGAVFTLMWNLIEAGKPFAGYVRNLASDGDAYDVFATVTPLPEGRGYLSVRQRPCRDDLYSTAGEIYDDVLAKETELRAGGMNRKQAAQATLEMLEHAVKGIGFESYEAFQDHLMTAEVAARSTLTDPLPYREGSSEVHLMLEEIWGEHAIVSAWRDRIEAESVGTGSTISPIHAHLARTEIHIDMCGYFLAELIATGYDEKIGLPGKAMGFASHTIWDEKKEESREERDVRERLESLEMLSEVLYDDVGPLRDYAGSSPAVEELFANIERVHAKVLMFESTTY
ncbi:PAS domain S-box-containing protein [Trueperella bonasi]|uniref:PAS domain S-box-containing protein n=1 Tax=Trueperella bonasi TaxID=312286 RepID=A0ABT9NHM9_9ACTO|nr:PAS domain-containing protein [Trueperella bonasi]MDP9806849.1 PAS domain S-box-containing protein [Trueperella bonasi]